MTRGRAGSLLAVLACLALVGWFWVRGERFIAANGPTFDEPAHLAAGYGYWVAGAFRVNPEHPPLLKLLWSLPLLFTDAPDFPRDLAAVPNPNHWLVAKAWFFEGGVPPRELLTPARRVNLALGCGIVLLVGWVAFRVWNSKPAGVAACAFAATDPTLLALAGVLTTDIGVSLFGFATCYLLWEYAANPTRGLLPAAGIALGLTLGAKFSAIGLVAGLGLAGAVFVLRGGWLSLPGKGGGGFRPALELAVRLAVVAVVTVAITYAFVHLPEWGKGLKFQLTRGGHGDGVAYLNGEVSRTGWYRYFLVAVPLKLPLGLLVAASVSAVSLLLASGRVYPGRLHTTAGVNPAARQNRVAFLVLPPVVFFALASFSRVNVGVRAVLPCVPFLYLLAAGLAAPGRHRLARSVLLAGCLAWCAVAVWRASPFEISYFNELAGGPGGGAEYLADSNLDWGQGLPALKAWMDANGVDAVYLGFFGTDRPEAHGIRYHALPGYGRIGRPGGESIPADAGRHVVAVSANHLIGLFLNEPETYAWLRGRTPTAVAGGSIHVFDLTDDSDAIARVRALGSR